MSWLTTHFQRYRQRTPWDFCWRIAIEGTLVSLTVAVVLGFLGAEDRKFPFTFAGLLCAGVVVAPVLETLLNGILIPLAFALGEV